MTGGLECLRDWGRAWPLAPRNDVKLVATLSPRGAGPTGYTSLVFHTGGIGA